MSSTKLVISTILSLLALVLSFLLGRASRAEWRTKIQPSDPRNGVHLAQDFLAPLSKKTKPPSGVVAEPPHDQITIDQQQRKRPIPPRPFADAIHQISMEDSKTYMPLYLRLGIQKADAEELVERLKDIHIRANIAQSSILELSEERKQYIDRIRSLLSPEKFQEYERFEDQKPIQQEAHRILDFGRSHQVDLEDYLSEIHETIEKYDGVLFQSTHGPYDPNPAPSATGLDLLPKMNADRQRILTALPNITNHLTHKIPPKAIEQVQIYYENYLNASSNSILRIISRSKMSPQERREADLRHLNEMQSRTDSSN